ncbi:MAG: hypothetical protein WAM62_13050 [Pseudolabrys sp.]
MKLNVLVIALAASAFGTLAASAQTTVIEGRRPPAVVIEQPPASSSVTVKEHGGLLGTDTKTTTETTGAGPSGDCSTRTVHKEGIGEDKTVSKTNCN